MRPLVETDWLLKNLDRVKIFDSSLHLPNANRNAENEFNEKHIPGSIFFDIDRYSDKNNPLPHMMTKIDEWNNIMSDFGITKKDHIVIYDNSELYSSCRLWFSFLYFGHDPDLVSVLNGGLKKWVNEGKVTTSQTKLIEKSIYQAREIKELILSREEIDKNIIGKKFDLIDARNKDRFDGNVKEPRKGLRSGSIPNSKNLYFKDCLNDDNTFKKTSELRKLFQNLDISKNMAFTCGSGVTACVLGLANSLINDKTPGIYDESWSGYGMIKNENGKKI